MAHSKDGTIKSENWDEEWWERVQKEAGPICGAKCKVPGSINEYEPCMRVPDTHGARCKEHGQVSIDPLYEKEELFKSGLSGLKLCGADCKNVCDYYSEGFELREVKPYCIKEYTTYGNQIKELLKDLAANKVEVRQYIKIAVQAIVMTLIQIMRCDQELASGSMVIMETQVFKSRDNERTIVTPKENPAIVMRTKLLKSLAELAKSLMIAPREKADDKGKAPTKSASEFIMDLVNRSGGIDGGVVAPRS